MEWITGIIAIISFLLLICILIKCWKIEWWNTAKFLGWLALFVISLMLFIITSLTFSRSIIENENSYECTTYQEEVIIECCGI